MLSSLVSKIRWQDLLQTHEEIEMATKLCGSCSILWRRLQDLLQYLEEVRVVTMSC